MLSTKQRVDRLEKIFGQFMTQTNAVIADLKEMSKDLKRQAAQDRQEWNERLVQNQQAFEKRMEDHQKQADQNRQQDRQEWDERLAQNQQAFEKRMEDHQKQVDQNRQQDRQEWNERWDAYQKRRDQERKQERKAWNQRLAQNQQAFEKRMEDHQKQIDQNRQQDRQEWNERLAQNRQEWEQYWEEYQKRRDQEQKRDRKAWNKRWGELANRLGTIVEDIVAPNMPRIAKQYFRCAEIDDLIVRRWIRNKRDRSKRREFDVIVVAGDTVILNETKATPKIEYINRFLDVLPEITDYFPEYQGKTIIPVFASLYMQEDLITYLTKHNVYAMTMGDETMEIVNFQELHADKREG